MFFGQPLMSNTLISRYKGRVAFAAISYAIWYLIFGWPIVHYPSYAKGPCYSPNREYYITSHQTVWRAIFSFYFGDFGTARLFDRSGKLLYEEETELDAQSGPFWLDRPGNDPERPSEVFYMDGRGPGWIFSLPTPPGRKIAFESCYLENVE